MNLYEALVDIYSYLHGIRKHEDYFIIDLNFPPHWSIPNKPIENVGVKVYKTNDDGKVISFYTVFDKETCKTLIGVVKEVIKLNKEKEEKQNLLEEKRLELEKLFNANSLDSLKNMSFMFNGENEYYEEIKTKLNTPSGKNGEGTTTIQENTPEREEKVN